MEQTKKINIFPHERVRGFVYAFVAFAALEVVRLLIVSSWPWYSVIIPSLFGSVVFFVALFALNDQRYKKYAQGALLGWLVYIMIAVGLKIIFTT